jgi:hypothetical protein
LEVPKDKTEWHAGIWQFPRNRSRSLTPTSLSNPELVADGSHFMENHSLDRRLGGCLPPKTDEQARMVGVSSL